MWSCHQSAKYCIFRNHFTLESEEMGKEEQNQSDALSRLLLFHASTIMLCHLPFQVSSGFFYHLCNTFQTLPALLTKNAFTRSNSKGSSSSRAVLVPYSLVFNFCCVSSISIVDIPWLVDWLFFGRKKKKKFLTWDPWSRYRTRLSPGRASWCALAMS